MVSLPQASDGILTSEPVPSALPMLSERGRPSIYQLEVAASASFLAYRITVAYWMRASKKAGACSRGRDEDQETAAGRADVPLFAQQRAVTV